MCYLPVVYKNCLNSMNSVMSLVNQTRICQDINIDEVLNIYCKDLLKSSVGTDRPDELCYISLVMQGW